MTRNFSELTAAFEILDIDIGFLLADTSGEKTSELFTAEKVYEKLSEQLHEGKIGNLISAYETLTTFLEEAKDPTISHYIPIDIAHFTVAYAAFAGDKGNLEYEGIIELARQTNILKDSYRDDPGPVMREVRDELVRRGTNLDYLVGET